MVWVVETHERRTDAAAQLTAFVETAGLTDQQRARFAALLEEYTDAVYEDASANATYHDGYGSCPTCGEGE